ncbi:MAG: hydrolase [Lachnospiraceae bacterium]|nr:hydrolase [Lachnospiraceae bacterium]
MSDKVIPRYSGNLRSHSISVPQCIKECTGIIIFGRRIKSLVFSTDVAIVKNINADAVLVVYPFTPQPSIAQAIISVSDVPVFVGVGGGVTSGVRSVSLAIEAEHNGAFGVVVNAPMPTRDIRAIKRTLEIPVIATIVSEKQDVGRRIRAGADILNVSAATQTPEVVRTIRKAYPDIPIIATGGPTDETILETIAAGANAITYTPPTNGELFAESMKRYRATYAEEAEEVHKKLTQERTLDRIQKAKIRYKETLDKL